MTWLNRVKNQATIQALALLPKNHMSRVAGKLASTKIPRALGTMPVRTFGSMFGVNWLTAKLALWLGATHTARVRKICSQ